MAGWRECIVTLIDVVGVKKLAKRPDTRASDLMRAIHHLVLDEMTNGLPAHSTAYVWNDSVLLLAYLNSSAGAAEVILREADALKRQLDALARGSHAQISYAISVQGQVFPDPGGLEPRGVPTEKEVRTVVIKASSYAMANCFLIEEHLGKNSRKPWYLDSRLAIGLKTDRGPILKQKLKLLPGGKERNVYAYAGYLWGSNGILPRA
jgi:hypothetical protein